ncbi:MAG: glycosyltransferase family 9 protein [Candidatus Firestonebacteria bacterium]
MKKLKKEDIKKILIVKFKGLGDILLSEPAIRAVKESFPEAKVTLLINKDGYDIVSGLNLVDEIICFDKSKIKNLLDNIRFINEIRKKKFDLVVDLFGNPRSAILSFLSGARYRLGMTYRFRKYFYNIKVQGLKKIIYNVEANLEIVRKIGADTNNKSLEIFLPKDAIEYIEGFLKEKSLLNKCLVGMNPFGSVYTRKWGNDKFMELSERLIKDGFNVVFIWGPSEKDELDRIISKMRNKPIVAPPTNLKQLSALIKRLNLLVTNTTVAQHIAVAFGVPTVTIFGTANKNAWNPPNDPKHMALSANLPCQPCEKTKCDDFKCMHSVSVNEVYGEVMKLMKLKNTTLQKRFVV